MYPSSILTDCIREDGEYRHLLREIFEAGKRDSDPLPLLVRGLSEGATDALTVSLVEDILEESEKLPRLGKTALFIYPEENTTAEERQNSFTQMMEIALELA